MTGALEKHQAFLCGCVSFAIILLAWQVAVDLGFLKVFFVSSPTLVAAEFWRQLADGEAGANTVATVSELTCGLGLALLVGTSLGVFASWSRTIEHILDPFIWLGYTSPTIAFYPLFVVWLGLGKPTVIAIAFIFAVTPLYANTLAGIRNADQDLLRAARSFGARRHDLFLKVVLPGSVPLIVAGLRLAVGRALTGVVAGELFGATAGLGFSIAYYGQKLKTTPMMVSLVLTMVLGVILTQLLNVLESTTDSWRASRER